MAPKKTNENNPSKKRETIKEKVRRHIVDKNDIITDQDFKDVPLGEVSPEQEEEGKEFADELSKRKQTTPWDILDEEE